MNRKQLILLLIVGLVLGGAGIYLSQKKSASFERTQKTAEGLLLGDFPVNDVAHVTLRQDTNRVNLVKDDIWVVQERNNYPANFSQISEFVRKLADLRAAQSQRIGDSQLGRLELLDSETAGTNAATVVELTGKEGKVIRSVRLGKQSMRGGADPMSGGWPNGRWIYLPDEPGTAYLVSETFYNTEANPEQWLKKDFLRVEKPSVIEVEFAESTNSWKLTRETESGEWKLADAEPDEQLDASKVSSVSHPLSSPSFNDVLPGNAIAGQGTDQPTIIRIGTFDGFAYTVTVGSQTNGAYLVNAAVAASLPKERVAGEDETPEDKERLDKEFKEQQQKLADKLKQEQALEKWTYLVPSWVIDPLLKPRADLLQAKREEAVAENDDGIEMDEPVSMPGLDFPPALESDP